MQIAEKTGSFRRADQYSHIERQIRLMSDIMVTRSSMPEFEEYTEEIKDLWETRWLTNMGVKHQQLIKELCRYLKVSHMDLFTNGHMSLELSLQALKLEGEVITTPYTFISTTHAIVRNGLKPVFCDINPNDFTIDVDQIESLINERTCAIMPVHVYGNVCDVEAIQKIADKHHLKVIYDAAHVFGVEYKGRGITDFGDVSCMSFHATKVFNTIEGGAAVFHDEEYGKQLWKLKDFGIAGTETIDEIGPNAKMNEFCAAMGLCNLRHVDEEIAKRKTAADTYRRLLGSVPGIQLSPIQKDVKPNYAYFPAVFDEAVFGKNRDQVFDALAENGIRARKYFYPAVNECDCYKAQYDWRQTPESHRISHSVLCLPMYAGLSENDVERICNIILKLSEN